MNAKHSEIKIIKKLAKKQGIKHVLSIRREDENEFTFETNEGILYFIDLISKEIKAV
ncbi:hypothetical protein [Liquorilactobacillus hordei]|uniref:PepSY domain-containing protein n=1 Tax=Liquorilactobacillus hordei DSM 19519 TaxID=1423759 RepID=A0A0R1MU71_9LACO|nr:hypothetical protein [Liquorilactobacillus hordei]KRL07955.1 hypothetical protein FC92_GL001023 [Liquorilactobacillus hordei DSM 19519]QYH51100.1 hypothetical protein G6O70_00635 [Liquorilactobacillus hordei DSM 19519]